MVGTVDKDRSIKAKQRKTKQKKRVIEEGVLNVFPIKFRSRLQNLL